MTHGLTVIPNITDMGLTATPGPAHSPLSPISSSGGHDRGQKKDRLQTLSRFCILVCKIYPKAKNYTGDLYETRGDKNSAHQPYILKKKVFCQKFTISHWPVLLRMLQSSLSCSLSQNVLCPLGLL